MRPMRSFINSLRLFVFGLATTVRFTVALVWVKLSGDPTRADAWLLRTFGLRGVELCGGQIGLPREPPRLDARPYVIVANHQSHLDVPLVVSSLPTLTMRFVAKPALFRLPLFGWYLRAAGHLEARRREEVLGACERLLATGYDVMFFPEGTRTPPGVLGPFRPGAFELAVRAGRPVLPLAIYGTSSVLASGSRHPTPGPVSVRIGRAIEPGEDAEALSETVREALQGMIEEGPLPALALRPPRERQPDA